MNVRCTWHKITHKHDIYAKGEATIAICSRRGPWGKAHIMYQPNPYIDPFPIDADQLKKVLNDEPL